MCSYIFYVHDLFLQLVASTASSDGTTVKLFVTIVIFLRVRRKDHPGILTFSCCSLYSLDLFNDIFFTLSLKRGLTRAFPRVLQIDGSLPLIHFIGIYPSWMRFSETFTWKIHTQETAGCSHSAGTSFSSCLTLI